MLHLHRKGSSFLRQWNATCWALELESFSFGWHLWGGCFEFISSEEARSEPWLKKLVPYVFSLVFEFARISLSSPVPLRDSEQDECGLEVWGDFTSRVRREMKTVLTHSPVSLFQPRVCYRLVPFISALPKFLMLWVTHIIRRRRGQVCGCYWGGVLCTQHWLSACTCTSHLQRDPLRKWSEEIQRKLLRFVTAFLLAGGSLFIL